MKIDQKEFDDIAEKALQSIPKSFRDKLENVQIVMSDSAPKNSGGMLPGLYQGVPLKNRGIFYGGALPDKITLYKDNIESICSNTEELKIRIKEVIIHEIGHHFGMNEKEIREAGY